MKTAGLEARLADMERVVDDLRRQRDAEAEERRRLTMVLADMRATPAPAPQPPSLPPPRRWWTWGRRA